MEEFIFGLLFIIMIIILVYLGRDLFGFANNDQERSIPSGALNQNTSKKGVFARCPICNYLVGPGEKVYAQYVKLPDEIIKQSSGRQEKVEKKRVEIQGCDHCLPQTRHCPRCGKELSRRDVVYALLTARTIKEKQKGKKDLLHIEGCINCYKR